MRFIDKPYECIACTATFCSGDRHGLDGVIEDAQLLGSLDDTVRCVRAVGDQEGSTHHEWYSRIADSDAMACSPSPFLAHTRTTLDNIDLLS